MAVQRMGAKRRELTGGSADAVIESLFVAAGERSEGFVAHGEEDDGDEGEEERGC